MKKVLGVMGSPRKGGNTDTLLARVREGVVSIGGEMEILPLRGLEIAECDGCHVCWQEKACSKKDDMNLIFPKIIGCDAVVFGTPVYWYGPTALIKAFIDRFVYFNCDVNRPGIRGKQAAVVVPFEETSEATAAPVFEFFERSIAYLGMRLVGTVAAPGVTKRGEVEAHKGPMDAAYALGRALVSESGAEPAD